MKTCSECKGKMVEHQDKTPEGFSYTYHKCNSCGEEIVDMKQLHQVADKYRKMKKYRVKLTKWGLSYGIRIPKELMNEYDFGDEVSLVADKKGLLIIP